MRIIIIGGGIIGLSSAYYLRQSGHVVTVIDKTDITGNCSHGNAGYVCPSHFVPLATPGIVKQGLKWMWNNKSPFYVQPRLSLGLVNWGARFIKSATPEQVEHAAVPLRDIALLSKKLYEEWTALPAFNFAYQQKGLLEIFQTQQGADHAHHLVEKAHRLGLTDTELLTHTALQQLEPHTRIEALGAVLFRCDAHLYPNKLMRQLLDCLKQNGVIIQTGEEVTGFENENGRINRVITDKNSYEADTVVVAGGAWSRELAALMKVKIPLVAGRGYSVTLENTPYHINYPAVLVEGRVALTPMDENKIRFGGTMEITSTTAQPRISRVKGILEAVKRYYPEFDVPMPSMDKIWYGYRPCSADGLPYLGRTKKWKNVIMATGHAMLGLSLGPGTGKLVSEMVNEETLSMDARPFNPDRFS